MLRKAMWRWMFVAMMMAAGSSVSATADAEIIQFKSADVPPSPFKARMAARQGKPAPLSVAGDVISGDVESQSVPVRFLPLFYFQRPADGMIRRRIGQRY